VPQLSPHFHTREFACHDGTPAPSFSYEALEVLCQRYLEPLRRAYGPVEVHSGYRTPAYNRAVGGAPASFHVYSDERQGVAADVSCQRGTPTGWYRAMDALRAPGLGRYGDHLHVDTRRVRSRW
jgi:uncharacterized protein YcbK (DUF882 family)